jgi:hypothetical protein
MRRSLTPIGLALVVAGALAGPPATARATTSIDRLNALTFPHRTAESICSTERRLQLKGTYFFAAYTAHRQHRADRFSNTRRLRLVGRYGWKVCLHRNRSKSYQIEAAVRNLKTGGRAQVAYTTSGTKYGNGYYDWGSTIDNVRG